MRRTLRPPLLSFTTSHSNTGIGCDASSVGSAMSGMVMPFLSASASSAGSSFGSNDTKWPTALMPTQIATVLCAGLRRSERLGGSPQRVMRRPRSTTPSGPRLLLSVADTWPVSAACFFARSLSTMAFASSRRQLVPPVSSFAESAGLGALSMSHGTMKCALERVAGRSRARPTAPR